MDGRKKKTRRYREDARISGGRGRIVGRIVGLHGIQEGPLKCQHIGRFVGAPALLGKQHGIHELL